MSVAVITTALVPIGKVLPEGGTATIEATPVLSPGTGMSNSTTALVAWRAATAVTSVVPTANDGGASLVTVTVPHESEALGVPRSTLKAEHVPASALTVMLLGQVRIGAVVSVKVMVWTQVAPLPQESVAFQVR